ncbi:MAG: cytochrome c-type biogenesis protein [Gemmatimonadota bacterium]
MRPRFVMHPGFVMHPRFVSVSMLLLLGALPAFPAFPGPGGSPLAGLSGQEGVTSGSVVPNPAVFQESQPFDDPGMEATVRMLATQLRCPTCQALSIEDSPSELSQQMKEVIRDRLREGMTPDEVKAHFVAAYGEWILLSPTPSGFNLLVYLLPLAAVVVGGALIALAMRKWMAATPGSGDREVEQPTPPAG